ncbi:MAG: endonuclease/exonuclease/phosphatase family protein [bacterium]|nr:endonuclease/exonuclease/phosphatase family protein [bacterium]
MPLRILTANLYNGRADAAILADALRTHSPDLVAVQELSANTAEVLRDWGTSHLLDPRDDTTGMGAAARFDVDFSRLNFPFRRPIRGRFDGQNWGLGSVDFISAHFVNPIARPLLESKRIRARELAALEAILADRAAAETRILVGDFNSSPAWPFYRRVSQLATDGALAAGTARRTWSYFPRSPRLLRIDHVFLQGAACRGTQLVTIPGADHRALLADIEAL